MTTGITVEPMFCASCGKFVRMAEEHDHQKFPQASHWGEYRRDEYGEIVYKTVLAVVFCEGCASCADLDEEDDYDEPYMEDDYLDE